MAQAFSSFCEHRRGRQLSLLLLAARLACYYGEDQFRVHEGVADYWMTTDKWRACEGNKEGIKHTALNYFVDTEDHCRQLCERRAECIAIDYYVETNCCLFFADECSMPQATADGASSYKMARQAEWAVIDETHACEGNQEHVKPYMGLTRVVSSEQCKQECERRSRCVAVDYYRTSWYCNLYDVACTHPVADHDGACSFRIVRQLKAQNYMELKLQRIVEAKRSHAWVPHSRVYACEKNNEGLKPFWRARVENMAVCSALCADHTLCTAFDYYTEDFECLLYKKLCVKPKASGQGASSWTLAVEPWQWEVIDASLGCGTNHDGVKAMDWIERPTLADCKQLCERIHDCVGVDWKGTATDIKKQCGLFNHSCLNPAAQGSSSYLITRPAEQPVAKELQGNSVQGWLQRHLRCSSDGRSPSGPVASSFEPDGGGLGISLADVPGVMVASIFATCWVGFILVLRMFCSTQTQKYL